MNFIDSLKPKAKELYQEWGILPSLTIAQAIHESNYGKSGLTKRAYNLFGMKGTGTAGSIQMPTWEEVDGKRVEVLADFRRYNSLGESLEDYGELLGKASRYEKVRSANSWKEAVNEIGSSGYATDSLYSSKLTNVIIDNELWKIDEEVGVSYVGGATRSFGKDSDISYWGGSPSKYVKDSGNYIPEVSEGESGFFDLNPDGWLESAGEWFKSSAFVITGLVVLALGLWFLFSGTAGNITSSVIKEVVNNE